MTSFHAGTPVETMKMAFANKTTHSGLRKHYAKEGEDYNKYRFTLENQSQVKTICFETFAFALGETMTIDQRTGDSATVYNL